MTHRPRSALLIGLAAASWVIASTASAEAANDTNKPPKMQGRPPAAAAPGPAVHGPAVHGPAAQDQAGPGPAAQEERGSSTQNPHAGRRIPAGKSPGSSSPVDKGTLGPASKPAKAPPATTRPTGSVGPRASEQAAGPRSTAPTPALPSTAVPSTVVPRSTVSLRVVTVRPRSVASSGLSAAASRDRDLPALQGRSAPAAPVAAVASRPARAAAAPERVAAAVVPVVRDLAQTSAQHAAVPMSLLAVVLLFLLLQHRIDARDPKLAGAPRTADPDLRFGTPIRHAAGSRSGVALT